MPFDGIEWLWVWPEERGAGPTTPETAQTGAELQCAGQGSSTATSQCWHRLGHTGSAWVHGSYC